MLHPIRLVRYVIKANRIQIPSTGTAPSNVCRALSLACRSARELAMPAKVRCLLQRKANGCEGTARSYES